MNLSKGSYYMIISIMAFSLMHLTVKFLPNIPVWEIILSRSLFSIIFCSYFFLKTNISPWGKNKTLLILRGVIGTVGLVCFFLSIQNIPLASAITIGNLMPFFALILASFFLKERIKAIQFLYFLISFCGVLFIKGFNPDISFFDLVIAVSGAGFAGAAHFLVRKLKETEIPLVIVFYLPLVSIFIATPFVFKSWIVPNDAEIILLCLNGIFTHIGQMYLTKSYQLEEISKVSNYYFFGILFALVFGYFLFDEGLTIQSIFGIVLIIVGVILNTRKKITN